MSREQRLTRLQKKLMERRRELLTKIRGDLDPSNNPDRDGDEGDIATYDVASELNTQIAAIESEELQEIDVALKKFEVGRYGICEMSGKLIPIARLEALPFTRFSVECQRIQEESGRPSSDFTADWETAVAQENRFQDREVNWREISVDD